MKIFQVAYDLLKEAVARKWFLGLGVALTLAMSIIGLSLRLDVVDGVLAASRLFGDVLSTDIQSVDVALRPVFRVFSFVVFYGGLILGILVCSGFAPTIFNEGRIEHLLSLPISRFELLAGTFLGVLLLSAMGTLYGTVGLTVILGVKTGFWTCALIQSGVIATSTFGTIYMAMLVAALFVRSAPLGAAVGGVVLVAGFISCFRQELLEMMEPGFWQQTLKWGLAPFPRVHLVASLAANTAQSMDVSLWTGARQLLSQGVFSLAIFFFGWWKFEQKDF
ncbi:MAG: hypothetical protein JXR76_29000 [Deltaproteobacteria bacterium]|nr:hypothetical protein [Deltaproteobacteria bacterium]